MKKIIFFLTLSFLFIGNHSKGQPGIVEDIMRDFGYNTTTITNLPSNVNNSFELIYEENDIFYINSSNQICKISKINGTWVNTGVIVSNAPTIRNGGKIHRGHNSIFYVANSDSKVYKLEFLNNSTWVYSQLLNSQLPLRSNSDITLAYPNVYYVCYSTNASLNNRICGLNTSNGINWTGGQPLLTGSNPVRTGTKLLTVVNQNLLYFVDDYNYIRELTFNGSNWVGNNVICNWTVAPNSQLATNGYGIYFVNYFYNTLYAAYWNNGWQYTSLPCSETIRLDVEVKYHDNVIYFVGNITGKLNIIYLNSAGSWNAIAPQSSFPVIKSNSKIVAYSNPIFEEGSSWATFSSHNVFFVDTQNKLYYLVYDDTPCSEISTYNMLWNTDGCKVNGVFPKSWQIGPDNKIEANKIINANTQLVLNQRDLYFIEGTTSLIKKLDRVSVNNNIITNNTTWGLSYNDEFNDLNTTQSKWNPQFHNGNTHQGWNKSHYNNYNNITYNNGIASIITKTENTNFQFWRKITDTWADDCHVQHYDYSSSSLQTGCKNCDVISQPLVSCSGASAPINKKFSQKYGWFEIRTKTPRGKGLWNAFWLLPDDYTWDNEVDIFEIPGNGKYIAQTNWTDFTTNGRNRNAKIINCIGYRTYEDFHTYSVKWFNDKLIFYLDNRQVGTPLTYYIPATDNMYMIINNYVNENEDPQNPQSNMMIESEVENFPNYWEIDYVRVYSDLSTPKSFQPENIQTKHLEFYPQPTSSYFSIKTDKEWEKLLIYDINANLIKSFSFNIDKRYDVTGLKPGIYIVEINSKDESIREKLIITGN